MTSLLPEMRFAPLLLDVAWPARAEDAAACARRFARMQENLALCDPRLRRWYEVGATAEQAAVPLPLAASSLARRFEQAHLPPQPSDPDADQGFDLTAWNGEQGAAQASLVVQVGSDRLGREWGNDMSNNVGIVLEPIEVADATLLRVEVLKPVLLALIDAWAPATGNLRPHRLLDLFVGDPPEMEQFRVHGGWMTYVAAPWRDEIVPPSTAIVEDTPDGGLLLVATREPFDATNQAHFAAALAIHRSLAPLWAVLDPPEF